MQFHAVGFAGDAFPQTIYLSATVLACDINEANSCEAQGCTACGTGYAPTGRKRRSAEHGEVSVTIVFIMSEKGRKMSRFYLSKCQRKHRILKIIQKSVISLCPVE